MTGTQGASSPAHGTTVGVTLTSLGMAATILHHPATLPIATAVVNANVAWRQRHGVPRHRRHVHAAPCILGPSLGRSLGACGGRAAASRGDSQRGVIAAAVAPSNTPRDPMAAALSALGPMAKPEAARAELRRRGALRRGTRAFARPFAIAHASGAVVARKPGVGLGSGHQRSIALALALLTPRFRTSRPGKADGPEICRAKLRAQKHNELRPTQRLGLQETAKYLSLDILCSYVAFYLDSFSATSLFCCTAFELFCYFAM